MMGRSAHDGLAAGAGGGREGSLDHPAAVGQGGGGVLDWRAGGSGGGSGWWVAAGEWVAKGVALRVELRMVVTVTVAGMGVAAVGLTDP